MVSQRALVFCSIISLVAAALVGCSEPYAGRMEVTGAVKLQGRALKDGSILFVPLDKQDTQEGSQILDGEYKIPRQKGLKPGKYLVRVTAGDGVTPARQSARGKKTVENEPAALPGPGGSRNIVSMDLIPDEWNARSKQQVEIKSNGANRFDFDIPRR
jgi:hypothetical protein